MKTQEVVNIALTGLDYLGYRLEELQITDKLNRHNTLAFVMVEQNRIRGELDSLNARFDQKLARVEKAKRQAEAVFNAGVQVATYPLHVIRAIFKPAGE
jgi:hypothetical protein